MEQAAFAKQVEIVCVNVMRIVEALARFSRPRPTILDAGQRLLIKRHGALPQFASLQNPRVIPSGTRKRRHWSGQPPRRNGMRMERCPAQNYHKDGQKKPHISHADMNLLVMRNA